MDHCTGWILFGGLMSTIWALVGFVVGFRAASKGVSS